MHAKHAGKRQEGPEEQQYFAVSPLLIRPWENGRFAVYLKQDGRYVLYTRQDEAFTERHRSKLFHMGVKDVYVPAGQKEDYESYLSENLGKLLEDDAIPVQERSGVLYEASVSVVRDLFEEKLPEPLTDKQFDKIQKLVKASTRFFNTSSALKSMARLIAHDYEIYNHSVNTLVFTSFLLQTFKDKVDAELLVRCGVGAILHDFGKAKVPKAVLDKRPDARSTREAELVRSHPSLGVGMCATVTMAQETLHCILFHHEQEDGKGYPSGLQGREIPFYVKALSVANAYDNLTTHRPGSPRRSPFEALNAMKARQGAYDPEMIKRLVLVLADAEIV
jgi:HD-GYP domain-containing protein (c-di-GMP phosphodiesterase class II)